MPWKNDEVEDRMKMGSDLCSQVQEVEGKAMFWMQTLLDQYPLPAVVAGVQMAAIQYAAMIAMGDHVSIEKLMTKEATAAGQLEADDD